MNHRRTTAPNKHSIPQLKPNQLIECRGSIWRYLGEQNGFWQLQLVRRGAHFSEVPVNVWALPQLEVENIRVLKPEEAYTPSPNAANKAKKELLSPFMRVLKNNTLEDSEHSKLPTTARLCAIETKPWQYEPWSRIVDTLPFPRLLIADDVGLGKTTEAAIILTELKRRKRAERVLIITPQHLCEKWQTELYERFGMVFEVYDRRTREKLIEAGVRNPWQVVENVIVSRDFIKRWENLKPIRNVNWDMVVIDECHHFVKDKNAASHRLRQLAEEVVYRSPGLLLLSATPFTGKKEQFHSLLELIDPKFQDKSQLKKWQSDNPLMVRRTKKHLAAEESFKDREILHHEVDQHALKVEEQVVLQRIDQEFQMAQGRKDRKHWDRLVEEVARKRLSSSWHAFLETISGEKRLANWFSDETRQQLKILIDQRISSKLETLAHTIQQIHAKEPKAKIVVFTEAIPTLHGIQDYLTANKQLKANEVDIIESATPTEQRLKIEANFSSKLKVLVATDTISEGKDLQHTCHHLIHFELPWSFVKIEQRNGRIDRLGQTETPYIHNLIFNTVLTPDQRVLDRLVDKIQLAGDALGSVSQVIETLNEIVGDIDFSEKTAEEIDKQVTDSINAIKNDSEQTGFSFADFTAMSPSPMDDMQDTDSRVNELKLIIHAVGATLTPYGKAIEEYKLIIPDDWEIRGLDEVVDTLPIAPNFWRVTFSPQRYLAYEKQRRQKGEDRIALHFISPIHPILQQIQTRFRLQSERGGYPVFTITGTIAKHIVIAELTARSSTAKILAQKMIAIDLIDLKNIDISLINDFTPANSPVGLPTPDEWQRLEGYVRKQCITFVENLKTKYDKKLAEYATEMQALKGVTSTALEQRQRWLDDLWQVDNNNIQYQVTALLIGSR